MQTILDLEVVGRWKNITPGESPKHTFTRQYLKIEQDVKIEFINLKNGNLLTTHKLKKLPKV